MRRTSIKSINFLLPLLCMLITGHAYATGHAVSSNIRDNSVQENIKDGTSIDQDSSAKTTHAPYSRLQRFKTHAINIIRGLLVQGLLRRAANNILGNMTHKHSKSRHTLEALLCTSTATHLAHDIYQSYVPEIADAQAGPTGNLTVMDKVKRILKPVYRYSPIGSALMCTYMAWMLPELEADMSVEHANCDLAFTIARIGLLGLATHIAHRFYKIEKRVKNNVREASNKTQTKQITPH